MIVNASPGAISEAYRLVEQSSPHLKGYLDGLLSGSISWGSEEVDSFRRTDKNFDMALNLLAESHKERGLDG